jgi:aminoglycoside phosphotransferase (APT) family kinase protein
MHSDEAVTDVALVTWLIAEQFPTLAALEVRPVGEPGTVNAVFRLGDGLCVRLPRLDEWAADLERELHWLPRLAPHLALQIPQPVGVGSASTLFPRPWAVYRWIEGAPYADAHEATETRAATDLARFVASLRGIPPAVDAPAGGRRPLLELDEATRAVLDPAALPAWEDAVRGPAFTGGQVWIHGDLLRPNLLVRDGRLAAVLDFGGVGVGDPAADVIAAWAVFRAAGRRAFRAALGVDDDTWRRARGFALHQAAMIIPYYAESNPSFVAHARRTLREVIADFGG